MSVAAAQIRNARWGWRAGDSRAARVQLIACIEEPDVAKKILEHLGLRAEPLPTLRAQAPPVTLELFPAS